MKHVRQPNDYTCGPAVVAIVTGARIEDLVAEMQPTPRCGTRHKRIVHALRSRGWRCDDRMRSARGKALPFAAIVRIKWPNKRGHVVVKIGNTWHDPLLDAPFTGSMPATREWSNGGRVTSFLWLAGAA